MIPKHYHEHLVSPTYQSSREKRTTNGYVPSARKQEHPKIDIGPAAVVNIGEHDEDKLTVYDRFAKTKTT